MTILEILSTVVEMGTVPSELLFRIPGGAEMTLSELFSKDWEMVMKDQNGETLTSSEPECPSFLEDIESEDEIVILPDAIEGRSAALSEGITVHGTVVAAMLLDGVITALRDRESIADNRFKKISIKIQGENK